MNKVYAILLWFALLFCHNGLFAQNGGVIVTGKVYAEDEPEGFIGATVIEQDKNGRIYSSALTDFNGNFSLKIKNPNNSLNFSFVGYKKLTVPIGNKRKFDVKLESQNVMKEVTVKASKLVGGGGLAIPEREYSGAMQKFNTKAIEGVSVASIDDALQGRIAGLDIVANSGDLGSGSVMRIRGITSINSNSQPLILLNGIPFESNIDASFDFASADQEQFASLLCISPDDIEEITVLKDGAAAAIWGSRGANGVIDITTKKGVTGPTRVSYSYRFSGSEQPEGTKLLNGDDYTMLMKQASTGTRKIAISRNIVTTRRSLWMHTEQPRTSRTSTIIRIGWMRFPNTGLRTTITFRLAEEVKRRSSGLLSDTISRRVPSSGRSCTVFPTG